MEVKKILEQVDRLFDENQAKEAEKLLLASVKEAAGKDLAAELELYNELIGYYRQTSEKEELLQAIDRALQLTEELELQGTIAYATTMLNAANGYRSVGDLEKAVKYYASAEEIYEKQLGDKDMLLAGFYNNYSLCCQELGNIEMAEKCLLKALEIVEYHQAGFEIAVTYANLANTAVMGGNYEAAQSYGQKAVRCFEERNLYDAHYCAALSALGMCHFRKEEFEEAANLFEKGMQIIESSLGRNRQYDRLRDNLEVCRKKMEDGKSIKGLELCREYYETYGRPMLEQQFAEYLPKLAIGLVGEGSDCMGYDDSVSADHDWGPGFCIWVAADTFEKIGEVLQQAYDNLPKEFKGFRWNGAKRGEKRRGVQSVEAFYEGLLGAKKYEEIDWSTVQDYALAAACDGEVFADGSGEFTKYRENLLAGYPPAVRLLRMAQDAAMFSQTGQYNYFRMLQRGDRLTADRMLADCIGHAMRLQHHICNVYPPHDKWLHKSLLQLENGREVAALLEQLHKCFRMETDLAVKRAKEVTEQLGQFFAMEMYSVGDISDVEAYLDYHTQELAEKARYVTMSHQDLVNRVAKLEFKAFDKVKNEGGRASCQNDWPTFAVMRKSQYLTWNKEMLIQYLYDFERELRLGHNLITEKYGRMMESTAPGKYQEIASNFPEISEEKKQIIETIVALQMQMMESFAQKHPKVADNARSLHTYEDNFVNTSYETYLRGEISTYSDKMLQLYGMHVARCASEGVNIAEQTIVNTAKLYGYQDMESFEASIH